jgi:hypothetical protein
MRLVSALTIACLLGSWLLAGCGTMPVPPPSPRIVETDDGCYRDGRKFSGPGALFWDKELVQGNARAERLLTKARWRFRAAWATFGLGFLGIFAVGSIPNSTARLIGPLTMAGVSVGALLYLSQQSYLDFRDAINVYNDDVIAREPTCAPPPALGGRP